MKKDGVKTEYYALDVDCSLTMKLLYNVDNTNLYSEQYLHTGWCGAMTSTRKHYNRLSTDIFNKNIVAKSFLRIMEIKVGLSWILELGLSVNFTERSANKPNSNVDSTDRGDRS